ncbi:hypothetical protein V5T82_02505 [Magnetovibrio sp. PR-2]|uniref:hypothetical protein n=1 Tax=Magnetovibrio sp. PR-2 TaxID=3120356 RepID=UPI002FCE4B37
MALSTGIKFKTSTPISKIEDWLDQNCNGEWDVEIEAISTELHQKAVAVYFETDMDRDAFKAAYNSIK